jgi:hypothetical protein
LRKVDDVDLLTLVDHDIKFIEIRVDQSVRSKSLNKVQKSIVSDGRLGDLLYFLQREPVDKTHQNGMTVVANGNRDREVVCVEFLHELELFERGDPRQVQPVVLGSSLQVISVLLDCFETGSSESAELQH